MASYRDMGDPWEVDSCYLWILVFDIFAEDWL